MAGQRGSATGADGGALSPTPHKLLAHARGQESQTRLCSSHRSMVSGGPSCTAVSQGGRRVNMAKPDLRWVCAVPCVSPSVGVQVASPGPCPGGNTTCSV